MITLKMTTTNIIEIMPLRRVAGIATIDLFPYTTLTFNVKDNKFLEVTGKQLFSITDEAKFGTQGASTELQNGYYQLVGTKDLHDF